MAINLRKVLPSSVSSPSKERYEYLLYWLSPNGGVRSWLFSSTEGSKNNSFKSEVIDTTADFRSIPNEENIMIDLTSKALSLDDFNYVSSIFKSNRVIQVKKDLSTIPVSIKSGRKIDRNQSKDFEVKVKIMLQEPDLMNV